MNKFNKGIAPLIAIIAIVAVVLIGGSVAYYYYTTKVEPILQVDQTTDWKTYENEDLSISFEYPAIEELQNLKLSQHNNPASSLIGKYFTLDVTESNIKSPFRFSTYSNDFQSFEGVVFNKKQIDVNWDSSQFASNMGIARDDVFFVKKLDNKSLLVAIYENYECSPYMNLVVLVPLSKNYPNLEITIQSSDIDKKLLKEYENKEIEKTGASCNMKEGLGAVAQNILDEEYPDLNNKIETARLIADSVNILNTDGKEGYYLRFEYNKDFSDNNWNKDVATYISNILNIGKKSFDIYIDSSEKLPANKGSMGRFNMGYYIVLNSNVGINSNKIYKKDGLSIYVQKTDSKLLPFIINSRYCKNDNDCMVRLSNNCNYGSYNKFDEYFDVGGCERTIYSQENQKELSKMCDETKQYVDIKYGGSVCTNNRCIPTEKIVFCKDGVLP